MAVYTAERAAPGFPVYKPAGSGEKCTAFGVIGFSTLLAAGDTVVMCKLPKGAVIIGGALKGDKLDSAGSGSALGSINIGLDGACVLADGSTVLTVASTSNCLLANLALGPDTAAVTGYKPEAGVRNVPLGGLLLTHGPITTSVECNAVVKCNASILAFTTGTMMLEVDYHFP